MTKPDDAPARPVPHARPAPPARFAPRALVAPRSPRSPRSQLSQLSQLSPLSPLSPFTPFTPFTPLALAVLAALAAPGVAQQEVEPFAVSGFSNPFFQHTFEFDVEPLWEVVPVQGDFMLHLQPNTDVITWELPPGRLVHSVGGTVIDHEGEPFGVGGSSSFIARASSGDFARYNASELGVPEPVLLSVDSPGVLTGEPLGDIVHIQLQASNSGGGAGGIGAYFDDITVTFADDAFVDVGQGLAGAHGVPALAAHSTLLPGSLLTIALDGALEHAPATLVAGFSVLGAPFKGGVMVPQPTLLVSLPSTGPDGALALSAAWPAGVPPGFTLAMQWWIVDPAGPIGLAASNGSVGTTP
jgi:hypothetical protein